MSTLLVVLLVVVTEVMGDPSLHAHQHHRFSRNVQIETSSRLPIESKVCTNDFMEKVKEGIIASKCQPKYVFVELLRQAAHQSNIPPFVWVKRCVGLQQLSPINCKPTKTQIIHVPVRLDDIMTHMESCATVPVEEHLECE